tara:strand:+ start:16423 stop:17403 length:981 start_codon:yes stop_codon:yes gene_type:complete
MKIAFLTEMNFEGKIPSSHPNMRTEFAWMCALDANHYSFANFVKVSNYDHVFAILPKGKLNLSAEGTKIGNQINPASTLLNSNVIEELKKQNSKVHYMQEGPSWWFNDYEIIDQFNFYNSLASCDSIFAHNEYDSKFYKGLFPTKEVNVMPTLLIEDLIKDIKPKYEEKVIIGGNFARWYGGFQSYMVADEFEIEKWTQESHAKREDEGQINDLNHLPRIPWLEWMNILSTFKYAVHLMPTIAAGTFSLNCAYFGIPCIGNEKVDTQRICHPDLAVDVDDVEKARSLAKRLKEDKDFYKMCSVTSRTMYQEIYTLNKYKTKLNKIL